MNRQSRTDLLSAWHRVITDYAQAMSWFIKAAGQGNSDAENQLDWMYQFRHGVQPDYAHALSWYSLAADQGSVQGANNLQILADELEDDGGESQNATSPVARDTHVSSNIATPGITSCPISATPLAIWNGSCPRNHKRSDPLHGPPG